MYNVTLPGFCYLFFKVGVHIADVSHFIRPGNALDEESAKRGTTVYLCEKVSFPYGKFFVQLSGWIFRCFPFLRS